LNCFRVTTYRSVTSDEVIVLHHALRIGQPGSDVDNHSAGGVAVDIDESGRAGPFAYNIDGMRVDRVPNGTLCSELPAAPHIDAIRKTAVAVASKLVEQRVLGIDLCVDSDGRVVLIEVNLNNLAVNLHQYSGRPYFGAYTAEVIEYCRARL